VFDMKKTDGIKVLATALALLVTGAAQIAKADDTEIYRVDEEQIGLESVRPKVLIVFDDSGSMRTTVTAQPPEYDTYRRLRRRNTYWSDLLVHQWPAAIGR
jgi:hypothetical protein